jgi:hypothetical protein
MGRGGFVANRAIGGLAEGHGGNILTSAKPHRVHHGFEQALRGEGAAFISGELRHPVAVLRGVVAIS